MSDLKSFKISDQVKQPVERPRAGAKAPPATPASAGFPRIEALVDAAQPELAGFAERQQALLALSKGKGTPKERAAAQKAHTAYVKVRALIDYLLETKRKMGEGR